MTRGALQVRWPTLPFRMRPRSAKGSRRRGVREATSAGETFRPCRYDLSRSRLRRRSFFGRVSAVASVGAPVSSIGAGRSEPASSMAAPANAQRTAGCAASRNGAASCGILARRQSRSTCRRCAQRAAASVARRSCDRRIGRTRDRLLPSGRPGRIGAVLALSVSGARHATAIRSRRRQRVTCPTVAGGALAAIAAPRAARQRGPTYGSACGPAAVGAGRARAGPGPRICRNVAVPECHARAPSFARFCRDCARRGHAVPAIRAMICGRRRLSGRSIHAVER